MMTAIAEIEGVRFRADLSARIQSVQMGTVGANSEEGLEAMREVLNDLSRDMTEAGGQSERDYMLDPNAQPDVEGMRKLAGPQLVQVPTNDGGSVVAQQPSPLGFTRRKVSG